MWVGVKERTVRVAVIQRTELEENSKKTVFSRGTKTQSLNKVLRGLLKSTRLSQ